MKTIIQLSACAFVLISLSIQCVFAHGGHQHENPADVLPSWHITSVSEPIEASFLMVKDGEVYLEKVEGELVHYPLASFVGEELAFVQAKMAMIEQANSSHLASEDLPSESDFFPGSIWLLLSVIGIGVALIVRRRKMLAVLPMSLLGAGILVSFTTCGIQKVLSTDPLFVDSAFEPFKPHVATRWDSTWFYIESNGLSTTHRMMAGITAWQQQVPIPQCYTDDNAWQIPLNPIVAAQPVPVDQNHFIRGALAIASNGIPIFNPYTNTGVDAFLDGQLDQWGGHCGRADDYHYHIAPMFLDSQSVDVRPIAFAFDGFAVYGSLEPDGSIMLPLDANHGHYDSNGLYHYHGSEVAPYMIGSMVGEVTEDASSQIIPQAMSKGVRPDLTPLNGATITDCAPQTAGDGYILTYTIAGDTFQVDYTWTTGGLYTFDFISPGGTSTETYTADAPCVMITGIDGFEQGDLDIRVFPNPTSGSIFLEIGDRNISEIAHIRLFDAAGKLVFQQERMSDLLEIGELPSGVYLVKIGLPEGEFSRKIIVQ